MKLKNFLVKMDGKAPWVILIGFTLFFVLDLGSSLMAKEYLQFLETNPLYQYVGLWGIILANGVAIYVLLKAFENGSVFTRYLVCSTFVYLSAIRAMVVKSNFTVVQSIKAGEITIEAASQLSEAAKQYSYLLLVISILLPILFSLVVYLLYALDHKIERKCQK